MSGLRISAAIRLGYIRALFVQPIHAVDLLPAGAVTSRITNSSNTITLGISRKLAIFIQWLTLFFAAYIVAFTHNWPLTLVTSSIVPFIGLVYGVTLPIHARLGESTEDAEEKATSLAGEIFGSIRTIFAFGAEGKLSSRYWRWIAESRRRGLRLAPLIGAQFAPIFFSIYCSFAVSFWFGVRQFSKHEVSLVSNVIMWVALLLRPQGSPDVRVTSPFFSVMMAVMAIGNITIPVVAMVRAATASTEIFDAIDKSPPRKSGLRDPEVSAREDVTFQDVEFAYPSRPDVRILDRLNVTFEAGKSTAIVGPSGSGKSTIIALLERWYKPGIEHSEALDDLSSGTKQTSTGSPQIEKGGSIVGSGCISVGQHVLHDIDPRWWRSQIGLVQQEPFLFNDTIYKNVVYGLCGSQWENRDESTKLAMVKEACEEAFAGEFIDRLPLVCRALLASSVGVLPDISHFRDSKWEKPPRSSECAN